jgi:hypothetical protein
MKTKKKNISFRKLKKLFRKTSRKKELLFFLSITLIVVFLFIFLIFYFRGLLKEERLIMKKELEKIVWQKAEKGDLKIMSEEEKTLPETFYQLKESGVERYFLSEVELIDVYYTPIIHLCLYEKGKTVFPLYVYETWSTLYFPDQKPEIALIKYLLLPEDNSEFQPNKSCYIKEIKTEDDWQEINEKYNFSKSQFSL